jgi:hypothetical protein
LAITQDHIHIESVGPESVPGHDDSSRYTTVTFRVLEPSHPNSFLVPVSVNIGQFGVDDVEAQARYVFHHLMRTVAETTRAWEGLGHPSGGIAG